MAAAGKEWTVRVGDFLSYEIKRMTRDGQDIKIGLFLRFFVATLACIYMCVNFLLVYYGLHMMLLIAVLIREVSVPIEVCRSDVSGDISIVI